MPEAALATPYHPAPSPHRTPYQPHLHQHYAQPQPQPHAQGQAESQSATKRPQYDYQPAHLQQPEPVFRPTQHPTPPVSPPSQPQHARAPPPGFASQALHQVAASSNRGVPNAQDQQFPPLHQAAGVGGKRQQSKAQMRQAQGQQQQQQQTSEPSNVNNWMAGFPDMQALQQQQMQVPQHSMPAGDSYGLMREFAQLKQQFEQFKQQQAATLSELPGNSVTTAEAQPGMRPCVGMPSRQQQQLESRPPRRLVKGLPETDLQSFTCPITHAVMWEPVMASDGHTYERSAIEEWLLRRPEGKALSPMTQVPMTRMMMPNIAMANLIRSKEAK